MVYPWLLATIAWITDVLFAPWGYLSKMHHKICIFFHQSKENFWQKPKGKLHLFCSWQFFARKTQANFECSVYVCTPLNLLCTVVKFILVGSWCFLMLLISRRWIKNTVYTHLFKISLHHYLELLACHKKNCAKSTYDNILKFITSVPQKRLPSAVVYYYCAW